MNLAESINVIGEFCGKRDIEELNTANLLQKYSIPQVDVMVLFGGSILAGGDVLAKAIEDGIAKTYVIVGGIGHTTESLRQYVRRENSDIETDHISEAEIFQGYLQKKYNCEADYLETQSTNCGNNITYLLNLLKEKGISCKSMILSQDATMQRRMDAGMKKYASADMQIINYASYIAKVVSNGRKLDYAEPIHGMWKIERYVNLLMGEIPRLTDDENGYGPKGKGYIAHVDIPENIKAAFDVLKATYGNNVREANPLFATKL